MVSLTDVHISRNYEEDGGPDEDLSYLSMESVFAPPGIGRDERRMQVRAYNHWLSQIGDGELPAIEDLRPETLDDLGPNGVLIDLTLGVRHPNIIFLGDRLAGECGDEREIFALGDVPSRSLLGQMTEHCLEVVAHSAPVGFDAEFVDQHGQTILYRSILLPYSSDGKAVDFIFGVISWKESCDVPPVQQSAISKQLDALSNNYTETEESVPAPSLSQLLSAARELAALAATSKERTRRALYAAIGRAHDFALAAAQDRRGLDALLDAAGIASGKASPLLRIARLVFGTDHNKTRLAEIASALAYAQRMAIASDSFAEHLLTVDGGLKGVVSCERSLQRAESGNSDIRREVRATLGAKLRTIPSLAVESLYSGEGEFALLVARRNFDGTMSLLGDVADDVGLFNAATRRVLAA